MNPADDQTCESRPGNGLVPRDPALISLIGAICAMTLVVVIFRSVLFEDGQFAFRDSATYYYPLYLKVQLEWQAGRIPLWDTGQNAGMPLLGNPTAAVLYPGKLLYAILPYSWAARVYVISHIILAYAGMLAFGRTVGLSRAASNLAGLSYAFGGPVLSQYCNVIYLVGAAWIPWGLRALDRLLRQGKPRGGTELALILALQVLGGDAEATYVTFLCGVLYAVWLSLHERAGFFRYLTWSRVMYVASGWLLLVLGAAWIRPAWGYSPSEHSVSLTLWSLIALALAWRSVRRRNLSRATSMLLRLAACAALALALAAAQILPVLEFAGHTRRASGLNGSEIYLFSLEPLRLVELLWPGFFGMGAPEYRWWLDALPKAGDHAPWEGSLYLGIVVPLLVLCSAGFRKETPWRGWLTIIAAVAIAASFGKYAGPLWWARCGSLAQVLGSHDPVLGRDPDDPSFHDGTGSFYSLLVWGLPGFAGFRYPAKLFPFVTAALAVLAGAGWDRVATGDTKRFRMLAAAVFAMSLVGLAIAVTVRQPVIAWLSARIPAEPVFGPADVSAAWLETQRALLRGAIVSGLLCVCLRRAWIHSGRAAAVVLVTLALDLAVANSRLILTAPQADFDAPSQVARLIEAAEHDDPAPGPFRIHTLILWHPVGFQRRSSAERLRESLAWNRATLLPLFALPEGLEYCENVGNLELDDFFAFFKLVGNLPAPASMASALGIPADSPLYYYPRRSYDLWGARYFILPAYPVWQTADRGFASFLNQTKLLFPDSKTLFEKEVDSSSQPWRIRQDWQLRRNESAYRRAWIVHSARVRPPVRSTDQRERLMDTLVFMNDPIWQDERSPVFDLHESALIETDRIDSLRAYLTGTRVGSTEGVTVIKHEPQRVELEARLDRPALVILADPFYPGWKLEIDGKPAPIYRANRAMRGAAVPAGVHSLVYRFDPASFRIGLGVSVFALLVLLFLRFGRLRSSPQPIGPR